MKVQRLCDGKVFSLNTDDDFHVVSITPCSDFITILVSSYEYGYEHEETLYAVSGNEGCDDDMVTCKFI